jgi:hypothetical protein
VEPTFPVAGVGVCDGGGGTDVATTADDGTGPVGIHEAAALEGPLKAGAADAVDVRGTIDSDDVPTAQPVVKRVASRANTMIRRPRRRGANDWRAAAVVIPVRLPSRSPSPPMMPSLAQRMDQPIV